MTGGRPASVDGGSRSRRADAGFLEEFLEEKRGRVEEALRQALEGLPGDLPSPLSAALRHGVLSGGKRLRPILCVAAYEAVGGEGEGIYTLAVSLELIHAYSLMHDDLPCMDDADLRRGEPTTHVLHGEEATMAAGALLIPASALQAWEGARAMGLEADRGRLLVEELARAAGGGGMVGGQVLDLLGEDRGLEAAELDELHERKTGALLRGALRMGGIAGEASPDELAALDGYGRAVGLAFQIADDLLDATATAETLGKRPSDVEMGKSTYVTLFGPARARERAAALVEEAVRALVSARLDAPELVALARYIVERKR